uniref:Uncharacterized protein n=1 Tax=Anguilla anguilla TaxID=7936 RepID=A0A0E9UQ59_ANGAN
MSVRIRPVTRIRKREHLKVFSSVISETSEQHDIGIYQI